MPNMEFKPTPHIAYSPHYYCDGCGVKLGRKSDAVIDALGEAHYENRHCKACEAAELAYLSRQDDMLQEHYASLDDDGPWFPEVCTEVCERCGGYFDFKGGDQICKLCSKL